MNSGETQKKKGREPGREPEQESPEEVLYPLAASFFIDDIDTLKVFADPLRLRILRTLYDHGEGRALSAKQIRKKLNEEGNNRLYYHVRLLEDAGLIRKVFERKRRNLIEAFFTPVAKRLHIAPELFLRKTSDDGEKISPLVDMAAAFIGALQADLAYIEVAPPSEVLLVHREFSLDAAQAKKMRQEFSTLVEKYEALSPKAGDGEVHRLTTIVYPCSSK